MLGLVEQKVKEFEKSEKESFRNVFDEEGNLTTLGKRKYREFCGVYIIYEGRNIIYIGKSGGGAYRIADLAYQKNDKFKHTLSQKIIKFKSFRNINEVMNFYREKCFLKVIKTGSDMDAEIVESIFIKLFRPKYNKELKPNLEKFINE